MHNKNGAATPEAYIEALDEPRRSHIRELYELIRQNAPGAEPHIQSGMIGFGKYAYRTKSCSGEWFTFGLSSLKSGISVYVCAIDGDQLLPERHRDLFPKASVGKSCIRFKRYEDIDHEVLASFIRDAAKYPPMGAV